MAVATATGALLTFVLVGMAGIWSDTEPEAEPAPPPDVATAEQDGSPGTGPQAAPPVLHEDGAAGSPSFTCRRGECVRWSATLDADLRPLPPGVHPMGDDALLVLGRGGLAAFEGDGETRWEEATAERSLVLQVATTEEEVVVATAESLLVRDAATGEQVWEAAGGRDLQLLDARRADDVLLLAFSQQGSIDDVATGYVRAYDAATGTRLWTAYGDEVVLDPTGAVVLDTTEITARDPVSGEIRWTAEPGWRDGREGAQDVVEPRLSADVLADALVVQYEAPGVTEVLLLDATTGAERAHLRGRAVTIDRDAGRVVIHERFAGGEAMAGLDPAGERVWTRSLTLDDVCCAEVRAGPGALLLVSRAQAGAALTVDPRTGRTVARGPLPPGELLGTLGPRAVLVRDRSPSRSRGVSLEDGSELWSVTDATLRRDVLHGAVLLVVGDELLAVEHPATRTDDGGNR